MQNNKFTLKLILFLSLVFFIFLFFSAEDRVFKVWKTENTELFSSFFWAREWSRHEIPIHSKVLVDVSDLKKWNFPFENPCLGSLRKYLYFRFYPDLRRLISGAKLREYGFRVERLGMTRRYKLHAKISLAELDKFGENNLEDIKNTMLEKNIDYYMLSFRNWRKIRGLVTLARFSILYSNKRFLFLSLKEKSD